jgi:hypothetical protein
MSAKNYSSGLENKDIQTRSQVTRSSTLNQQNQTSNEEPESGGGQGKKGKQTGVSKLKEEEVKKKNDETNAGGETSGTGEQGVLLNDVGDGEAELRNREDQDGKGETDSDDGIAGLGK